MSDTRQIKKLDEAVINRIAAGEVIQRPANALKELIENCLDAKSTNIQISVKNGGLKSLQIQDNGVGIKKDDFEIVCERFTTSKLREFEDLKSIATYGFRGEALASISHVAHLTIQSKTENDKCAYRASYVDGKLQAEPKPVAGNQGTQITVEDLFYNMNVRRKALRSPAEEYQKISEVVSKYAVHNATVGFSLKKSAENIDIKTPINSNHVDNIRIIYGNAIARELIEFHMENEPFKFKATGYITNVNYSAKKFVLLLFINHRLVDCQSLKKCIDQVYTTYLPKNTHPFAYLSIEIDPRYVDVNVHPTKHEVHFLNEDQIVELITTAIETKLLGSNNSRMFFTQAKLPTVTRDAVKLTDKENSFNKSTAPKDMVRTDCTEQKLEKFFGAPIRKSELNETAAANGNHDDSMIIDEVAAAERNVSFENKLLNKTSELINEERKTKEDIVERDKTNEDISWKETKENIEQVNISEDISEDKTSNQPKPKDGTAHSKPHKEKINTKTHSLNASLISRITKCETKLTSVLELRKQIEENCHTNLRELFSQHVFVGCVDTTRSLIQHGTKLYLCNTQKIMEELFYQIMLYNFQNFGVLQCSNALSINELAIMALDLPETGWVPEDGDKTELAERTTEILTEKGEMLNEYFSMDIDENGYLKTLPLLLDQHTPDISGLPLYILRLATEVDWETEKECFDSFCRETAMFYAQSSGDANGNDWKWVTEHVLYSAAKECFLPPKKFIENAAVLEIADLPSLYKVFERC